MSRTHPRQIPRKPEGQPTRGKTAPARLRRVDRFVALYADSLLRREDAESAGALVVDLGFGAEAVTTLEMARTVRRLNPALRVLGVEIDPLRVAAALPFADAQTEFRLGGFNLPLREEAPGRRETVRLIRAFNVLRQYDESAVAGAWARLATYLLPGGLLVEGTSDPSGRLWVANLLRRVDPGSAQEAPLQHEALVFSMGRRAAFDPAAFQPVLPKNLIHHVLPGAPIHEFLLAWKQAAAVTAPLRVWGERQWFTGAAEHLARQGWRVELRRRWLRSGYLVVRGIVERE